MINHTTLTLPDRRIISVVSLYPPPASANLADDQPWSHFTPLLRRPLGGTKKKTKKNNKKHQKQNKKNQYFIHNSPNYLTNISSNQQTYKKTQSDTINLLKTKNTKNSSSSRYRLENTKLYQQTAIQFNKQQPN